MISIINHEHAKTAGISALEYMIADWIAQETSCQKTVTNLIAIAQDVNISTAAMSNAIHNLLIHKFLEKKGKEYHVTLQWHRLSKYGVMNLDDKVKAQIERKPNPHKELACNVIKYLNGIADRSFDENSIAYLDMVTQLMYKSPKLGFKQFKAVIDHKHGQWENDDEKAMYIRPQTLFQTKKFFLYLEEARETYISEKKGFNNTNSNII